MSLVGLPHSIMCVHVRVRVCVWFISLSQGSQEKAAEAHLLKAVQLDEKRNYKQAKISYQNAIEKYLAAVSGHCDNLILRSTPHTRPCIQLKWVLFIHYTHTVCAEVHA